MSFTAVVQDLKISVIPSICFEDTVPRAMSLFVRDEPQVFVNVTNDGWFAQVAAAAQHFTNQRMGNWPIYMAELVLLIAAIFFNRRASKEGCFL